MDIFMSQQDLTPPVPAFPTAVPLPSLASIDTYRELKHFALLKKIVIDEYKARQNLDPTQTLHIQTHMAVYPANNIIRYSCDLVRRCNVSGVSIVLRQSTGCSDLIEAMEALWREVRSGHEVVQVRSR